MSNIKKSAPAQKLNKRKKASKKSQPTQRPKQKKLTAKEKAWFSDMNQIEWAPFDPYGD